MWLRPTVNSSCVPRTGLVFRRSEFPVAACDAVTKLPTDAKLLAPDKYGGYLIYRFNASRKVYFDGRSDFYGLQYMKDYLRLIEVRAGWQEELQESGFTHALLPERYSLIPALQQLGWKRLYTDRSQSSWRSNRNGSSRILMIFGAAWISAAFLTWLVYANGCRPGRRN